MSFGPGGEIIVASSTPTPAPAPAPAPTGGSIGTVSYQTTSGAGFDPSSGEIVTSGGVVPNTSPTVTTVNTSALQSAQQQLDLQEQAAAVSQSVVAPQSQIIDVSTATNLSAQQQANIQALNQQAVQQQQQRAQQELLGNMNAALNDQTKKTAVMAVTRPPSTLMDIKLTPAVKAPTSAGFNLASGEIVPTGGVVPSSLLLPPLNPKMITSNQAIDTNYAAFKANMMISNAVNNKSVDSAYSLTDADKQALITLGGAKASDVNNLQSSLEDYVGKGAADFGYMSKGRGNTYSGLDNTEIGSLGAIKSLTVTPVTPTLPTPPAPKYNPNIAEQLWSSTVGVGGGIVSGGLEIGSALFGKAGNAAASKSLDDAANAVKGATSLNTLGKFYGFVAQTTKSPQYQLASEHAFEQAKLEIPVVDPIAAAGGALAGGFGSSYGKQELDTFIQQTKERPLETIVTTGIDAASFGLAGGAKAATEAFSGASNIFSRAPTYVKSLSSGARDLGSTIKSSFPTSLSDVKQVFTPVTDVFKPMTNAFKPSIPSPEISSVGEDLFAKTYGNPVTPTADLRSLDEINPPSVSTSFANSGASESFDKIYGKPLSAPAKEPVIIQPKVDEITKSYEDIYGKPTTPVSTKPIEITPEVTTPPGPSVSLSDLIGPNRVLPKTVNASGKRLFEPSPTDYTSRWVSLYDISKVKPGVERLNESYGKADQLTQLGNELTKMGRAESDAMGNDALNSPFAPQEPKTKGGGSFKSFKFSDNSEGTPVGSSAGYQTLTDTVKEPTTQDMAARDIARAKEKVVPTDQEQAAKMLLGEDKPVASSTASELKKPTYVPLGLGDSTRGSSTGVLGLGGLTGAGRKTKGRLKPQNEEDQQLVLVYPTSGPQVKPSDFSSISIGNGVKNTEALFTRPSVSEMTNPSNKSGFTIKPVTVNPFTTSDVTTSGQKTGPKQPPAFGTINIPTFDHVPIETPGQTPTQTTQHIPGQVTVPTGGWPGIPSIPNPTKPGPTNPNNVPTPHYPIFTLPNLPGGGGGSGSSGGGFTIPGLRVFNVAKLIAGIKPGESDFLSAGRTSAKSSRKKKADTPEAIYPGL